MSDNYDELVKLMRRGEPCHPDRCKDPDAKSCICYEAADAITALVKDLGEYKSMNTTLVKERDFAKAQLAGTNKNIAGWLEARDDNLKRALAAEAEVVRLREALEQLKKHIGPGYKNSTLFAIIRKSLEPKP